jgi:hypothetical protein
LREEKENKYMSRIDEIIGKLNLGLRPPVQDGPDYRFLLEQIGPTFDTRPMERTWDRIRQDFLNDPSFVSHGANRVMAMLSAIKTHSSSIVFFLDQLEMLREVALKLKNRFPNWRVENFEALELAFRDAVARQLPGLPRIVYPLGTKEGDTFVTSLRAFFNEMNTLPDNEQELAGNYYEYLMKLGAAGVLYVFPEIVKYTTGGAAQLLYVGPGAAIAKKGSGTPSTPSSSTPPSSTPPATPAPTGGSGASAAAIEVIDFEDVSDRVDQDVASSVGSPHHRAAQMAAGRNVMIGAYRVYQSSTARNITNAFPLGQTLTARQLVRPYK